MSSLEELIQQLAHGGRRLGELPAWTWSTDSFWPFGGRQRRRRELRGHILQYLISAGNGYLATDENPRELELPGSWESAGVDTWRVPAQTTEQELAELLLLGNWCLYRSSLVVDSPFIHPWRERAVSVATESMARRGVELFVQSFHDDREWLVVAPSISKEDYS